MDPNGTIESLGGKPLLQMLRTHLVGWHLLQRQEENWELEDTTQKDWELGNSHLTPRHLETWTVDTDTSTVQWWKLLLQQDYISPIEIGQLTKVQD